MDKNSNINLFHHVDPQVTLPLSEYENLKAEIAQRDERISELEEPHNRISEFLEAHPDIKYLIENPPQQSPKIEYVQPSFIDMNKSEFVVLSFVLDRYEASEFTSIFGNRHFKHTE